MASGATNKTLPGAVIVWQCTANTNATWSTNSAGVFSRIVRAVAAGARRQRALKATRTDPAGRLLVARLLSLPPLPLPLPPPPSPPTPPTPPQPSTPQSPQQDHHLHLRRRRRWLAGAAAAAVAGEGPLLLPGHRPPPCGTQHPAPPPAPAPPPTPGPWLGQRRRQEAPHLAGGETVTLLTPPLHHH